MGTAPGQPNYFNDFMRTYGMMSDLRMNQEKMKYYGAEKEARIAEAQEKTKARQEKQIAEESGEEFSTETGLPYDPKKDEPYIAKLRAAKRSAIPQPEPIAQGSQLPGLYGWVADKINPPKVAPRAPVEDPDIVRGRQIGIREAMVPDLYEKAQRQAAIGGYNDPKSPTYSPEVTRAVNTRTMRPEDVEEYAKNVSIGKEHQAKAVKEGYQAETAGIGLTVAEENRRLTKLYSETDDPKTKDAALRRIALNNGKTAEVDTMNKNQRDVYMDATTKANTATEKLLKAQKEHPNDIGFHTQIAREASIYNRMASEAMHSPTTDLVTALPYDSWNPFSKQWTKSNLVKVPTEFARAEHDGVIEAMIRAPVNDKDSDAEQDRQQEKQGKYLAWKIIEQNPELLGNPEGFKAAVDKNKATSAYVRLVAKHHMTTYMQMNEDRRSDAEIARDKKEGAKPLGPETPPAWSVQLPGGPDPFTGERMPGPGVSSTDVSRFVKGILPEGRMYTPAPGVDVGGGASAPQMPLGPPTPPVPPASLVPQGPRGSRPMGPQQVPSAPAPPPRVQRPPMQFEEPGQLDLSTVPPGGRAQIKKFVKGILPEGREYIPRPEGEREPPRGDTFLQDLTKQRNLPSIKGVPKAGANIPPDTNKRLIDAVIKAESSGDPTAVGSKGEIGLMQLREAAAAEMGLTPEERKDPVKNREAGTRYLEKQIRRFGSAEKGLAAYNWGPANVEKAIAERGERWMEALPSSTVNYIKKILESR